LEVDHNHLNPSETSNELKKETIVTDIFSENLQEIFNKISEDKTCEYTAEKEAFLAHQVLLNRLFDS
jgi:hypothetical protein